MQFSSRHTLFIFFLYQYITCHLLCRTTLIARDIKEVMMDLVHGHAYQKNTTFQSLKEIQSNIRFLYHAILRPLEMFLSFIPLKWQNSFIFQSSFRPEVDIPDLSEKVLLVTGGNSTCVIGSNVNLISQSTWAGNGGIGQETILQLTEHSPAHIFLAARTEDKAEAAISTVRSSHPNVKITYLQLDLSSMDSVSSAAKKFISLSNRLDVLILNAGIMAAPFQLTKDGFDIQLATNHVIFSIN